MPNHVDNTTNSLWLPVVLLSVGAMAHAETLPTEMFELPMLTVTANKQTQTLESVEGSISAFSGEDLEATGIDSLEGVAQMVPGLTFQASGQSGLQPPVMRGLTANIMGFSSSVALVVDGVPTLRGQGFDNNLLGIERVEVLRGPQSTLYGRNAEAGVINIITRKPGNAPYAVVSVEAGSRDKHALRFDASHALIKDSLYLGAAGEYFEQDGFINNDFKGDKEDDRRRRSGRMALRWTPGDQTDATLRFSQQEYRDDGSLWGAIEAPRGTVQSGTDSWNDATARTLSLNLSHEWASGLRLRSITANNEFTDRIMQDIDFMPADMLHVNRDHHFRTLSQELRLESKWGQTQWLAGFYADYDDHDLSFGQKTPMGSTTTSATQKGDSTAFFANWIIPVDDRWTATVGGRIEQNEVRFALSGDGEQSREWTRFSPKLALQYQWSPNAQLYTTLADGFRSGGFNAFAPEAYRHYEPERVRSIEVGIKGRLLNRRLRYSASAYFMDVHDMQVQQSGLPGEMYLTNAASARPTGIETELEYLLGAGWQLQAAISFNRTRFREFQDGANNFKGNHNPLAPDATGYLGVRYDALQGWYAQAHLNGTSKIYLDSANKYSRTGYGVLGLRGGYIFEYSEVSAYVHNAMDKQFDTIGFLNGGATIYSPPREVGLRLTYNL